MIDTSIEWHPVSPTTKQLLAWVSHPLIFPNGVSLRKYFQNAKLDDATITFVFYPPNPPRYPTERLSIQLSLPSVLYGNNVKMITTEAEIERAIQKVDQFIAEKPWLPKVDFGSGILWRVDATYNHQVGEYVPDYVRAISKLDYPMRDTEPYLHEGVQFKSKVATVKFYDKYRECSLPSASGILRQEATLRHTHYIERSMHKHDPTLRDVSIHWLSQVLQMDLKRLHLNGTVIAARSHAQYVLEQQYGWKMGGKLFAHLYTRQSMTRQQMIVSGRSERTMRKYDSMIADAGLALTLADDGLQLPPLAIPECGGTHVPVSLSDTQTGLLKLDPEIPFNGRNVTNKYLSKQKGGVM